MKRMFSLARNLFRVHVLNQRVPLFVQFMLTNRCNALCKYCNIPLRERNELSSERVITLIDEMVAAGVYKLGLYGGEPLLRKDIHAIVSYAKKTGLMVHLYTNGILVDKHLETVKLLDGVFISLDGPEEIHDAIRGKGNFKKAIDAIETCSKYIPVFINCVITKQNAHQLRWVHELALKYDCPVNFQAVFNTPGLSGDISNYELSHEEFVACLNEIAALKQGRHNIALSDEMLRTLLGRTPNVHKKGHILGVIECWQGTTACVIDAEGTLYSCYQLIGREKALNLKEHSFLDAWNYIDRCSCEKCDIMCNIDFQLWQKLNLGASLNLAKLLYKATVKKIILKRNNLRT